MTERDGEEYNKLSLEGRFKFSCHKGLSCFNRCCSDVNIFLTPYDILRLRKALNIQSGEFLRKYTVSIVSEHKFPMVLLKMKEDKNKKCQLVTVKGCSVYNDRPWACRMYPIGTVPQTPNSQDGEEFYLMAEKSSICLGIKESKEWTTSEWLEDQGINTYNRKNDQYNSIVSHSLFNEGKELTWEQSQMLYVALYDIDRFRKLIFNSTFFDRFDIKETVKQKIKTNDEALLKFGYDWLRFSLFKEDAIKIKDGITKKKSQNKRKIKVSA